MYVCILMYVVLCMQHYVCSATGMYVVLCMQEYVCSTMHVMQCNLFYFFLCLSAESSHFSGPSGEDGNRGIEPSGNVRVLESSNITFTGCAFRHLGGLYAISANFGSKSVRILNSTFADISGGAVHIGSSGSRWNTGKCMRVHRQSVW